MSGRYFDESAPSSRHRCGLGLIPDPVVTCGSSSLLVPVLAPRVYLQVLRSSSLHETNIQDFNSTCRQWARRATSPMSWAKLPFLLLWYCSQYYIIIIIIIIISIIIIIIITLNSFIDVCLTFQAWSATDPHQSFWLVFSALFWHLAKKEIMVRRIKPSILNFVAICMQYHTMKKKKLRERENDGEKSRHWHPYRSLRAVHLYWSFRCERFFVCEELCGLEQREPVRGLGTSCKPLSDSSQISTREEKRTSCKADNEALVVGYSYY